MKKLFFITLAFFASVNLNAQSPAWVCMNVSVDPAGQDEFVEALDNFMESVDIPFNITLNAVQFANSDVEFSHQLCFLGESADSFAFWGISGPPPSVEGVLFSNAFEDFAEVEQVVLGQPIVFSEDNLDYDFSAVYAMNVSDPQVFGGAFIKLNNSYNSENGSFELHEAVIGQESDVTHYWVVRSNNLATFLNARAEFFNSDELAEFVSSAQGSFEPVFSFGARILKQYN
tara:strand:+ start:236 stop:925 length:690 start_codon:yes stop_codon:yes gene_type:complete